MCTKEVTRRLPPPIKDNILFIQACGRAIGMFQFVMACNKRYEHVHSVKPKLFFQCHSKREIFSTQYKGLQDMLFQPKEMNHECTFAPVPSSTPIYLLTYMGVFGLGFVTGKLPQYFTKPDIWHLGLNLNVSRSFSAAVSFNLIVVCMHFGRKKLL